MALFESHFFSDTLGLSVSCHVLLPQQTQRQIGMDGSGRSAAIPTLYLLHGLSDDHTIWMRRTSIERYAAARGIAVVMPAVGRSFYQNTASGTRYWSYISEELPRLMQQFFRLSPAREDNFAAGLSMGGYGALRLALACPDRFVAAASLSGALDVQDRIDHAGREGSRMDPAELRGVFGQDLAFAHSEADLFQLAQTLTESPAQHPDLFICCGTEDHLLPNSRKFHDHLTTLNYPHTYNQGPGDHHWDYWDAEIQTVLKWLPIRQS